LSRSFSSPLALYLFHLNNPLPVFHQQHVVPISLLLPFFLLHYFFSIYHLNGLLLIFHQQQFIPISFIKKAYLQLKVRQ
jgi:hypothetical protein